MSSERDEPGHWKQQYFQTLQELDFKEKAWAGTEQVLRRTLGRLALATSALRPSLDRRVEALREAIRCGDESEELEALARAIADAAGKPAEDDGQTGSALLDLLDHPALPATLHERAAALRERLSQLPHETAASTLRDEVAQLIATLLREHAEAAGADLATLVGPLLGDECIAPALRESLGALDAAPDPEARAAALAAAAQTLREALATPGAPEETTGADSPVHDLLFRFIERLDFPVHLQPRVEALKEQLGASQEPPAMLDALSGLATLVTEVQRDLERDKREAESFLQHVTERLHELDDNLRQDSEQRRESLAGGRELREHLAGEVSQIRNSVSDATDIGELKRAVERGLEAVHQHMHVFMESEERRARDAETRATRLGERLRDMETQTHKLRESLRRNHARSMRDGLTGLANRLAYDERIVQEHERWKRYGTTLSIGVVDVDHFKSINDRFGHLAGDKALKTIAAQIRARVRKTDFVARYGGEEFVLVMPGIGEEAALLVAEKLRESVAECPFHYHGQPVSVTISCGITEYAQGDDPESAFARADAALYAAKEAGRNRCLPATERERPQPQDTMPA